MESTRDTITHTVTAILPEFKGQSDVYQFESKHGKSHFSFASNGDFFLLFQITQNGKVDSVWLRMPTGSGGEVNEELNSEEEVSGPAVAVFRTNYVGKNGGAMNVTVPAGTFAVRRGEGVIESYSEFIINGVSAQKFSIYNNIRFDYAPEIGFLVGQESSITNEQSGSIGPGSFAELISYDLK